jgi:hypothetical protein
MELPVSSTPRCSLSFAPQVSNESKRKADSGELDQWKQQTHDHQQQQAATVVSCTYVGNVEMALTRVAYQVQSFQHAMGLKERQLEQQIVVAHVKDIEVKETKADMEQMKLEHRHEMKEHMQRPCKCFHLGELAKHETVEMAIKVDGTNLYKKLHHVTIWFKICDKCACDPITGELIFHENLPDGE